MNENMKLELLGSIQLVIGIILILMWSFFSSEWWSVVFGFLAVFFLIEAIWHFAVCDIKRHFSQNQH